MNRLEGVRALITGGASGFGKGIAEAFLREGASTLIVDIDGDKAGGVVEMLGALASRARSCKADVTDENGLCEAVAYCESEFDGLDVVVANAGLGQRPCPVDLTKVDMLRRQFEVNSVGAFLTCRAALPALRRSPSASILLTVSGIALVPRPQLYGYGMAKAATMYFMKSLALELAPEKIRVNGLFPAVGNTPMLAEFAGGDIDQATEKAFADALPLGRLITPEDVGHAAVFLSSPQEAGALTGCALPVDAGRCI